MSSDTNDQTGINLFGAREILLRITNACNQKCVFCNTDGMRFNMDVRDVYRACYDVPRDGTIPIFTGGEPTIHTSLATMARVLSEMGFQEIGLQTNAIRAADQRYAALLKRAGISCAIVSLHSHDSDISDTLTRAPGDFKATLAGIRNLMSNEINVVINHVLNQLNYRDAERFVDFLMETFLPPDLGLPGRLKALSLSLVQPVGNAFANKDIVPRLSDAGPFFTAALKKCRLIGLPAVNPGCGIPVCFTPGFESSSSEYHLLSEGVLGVRTIDANRPAKTKGPHCPECAHDKFCLGVWSNYKDLYGLNELCPVVQSSASEAMRKRHK